MKFRAITKTQSGLTFGKIYYGALCMGIGFVNIVVFDDTKTWTLYDVQNFTPAEEEK